MLSLSHFHNGIEAIGLPMPYGKRSLTFICGGVHARIYEYSSVELQLCVCVIQNIENTKSFRHFLRPQITISCFVCHTYTGHVHITFIYGGQRYEKREE